MARSIEDDNPGKEVYIVDRGDYVRIHTAQRCRLTRATLEQHLGCPCELRLLEIEMPSFSGRLRTRDDEFVWLFARPDGAARVTRPKRMGTNDPPTVGRPRLKTWSAFGNLGRRPSDYEIVTHKMNHTLRETPLELSADRHGNRWLMRHRDGIRLKVADWNEFRDPDELTYRKYVTEQECSEIYLDGILQEYERIGGTANAPDFLQACWTPSRYLVHGQQMLSAYLQQLASSTYVGNCAAFQTADQLRRVQRVAYRTRDLDRAYPARSFGKTERTTWERSHEWQGLRKGIERLLVRFDWDDAFVGLNLVVKPLADEITLRQFAAVARRLGTDLDALLADNLFLDAERSRRWSAALTRFAIARDGANRKHLLRLLGQWQSTGDEIIDTGSRLLGSFLTSQHAAGEIAKAVRDGWHVLLSAAGLQIDSIEESRHGNAFL